MGAASLLRERRQRSVGAASLRHERGVSTARERHRGVGGASPRRRHPVPQWTVHSGLSCPQPGKWRAEAADERTLTKSANCSGGPAHCPKVGEGEADAFVP